jgi:hypothetical protein
MTIEKTSVPMGPRNSIGWQPFWLLLSGLGLGLALVGGCTGVTHSTAPAVAVAEPSRSQPVTAGMGPDPHNTRAGGTFLLLVYVRIAAGYHIYGRQAPLGPFAPLTLTLTLPDELEPANDWIAPKPTITKTGESVYSDSVLLRRLLRVRSNAPDKPLSIKGELLCQACSDELCWPPTKIALSASVEVVSKPKP